MIVGEVIGVVKCNWQGSALAEDCRENRVDPRPLDCGLWEHDAKTVRSMIFHARHSLGVCFSLGGEGVIASLQSGSPFN
jgi:hypothetical protein